jgi:hypothetical protein
MSIRWTVALSLVAFVSPALAELPPQFTTWSDFAAVVAQSAIPNTLGVVDRIERTASGTFVVHAGACHVDVTVYRESAKDADGRPLVGPSHITKVVVGEKRCTP